MLTNLTKVIMANDPPLRDAWLSRIPAVSTLRLDMTCTRALF